MKKLLALLLATSPMAVAFGGSVITSLNWALPTEARGLFLSTDLTYYLSTQYPGYPIGRIAPAFNWRPPCGCASLGLRLDWPYIDGRGFSSPEVNFYFDLKSLGR